MSMALNLDEERRQQLVADIQADAPPAEPGTFGSA